MVSEGQEAYRPNVDLEMIGIRLGDTLEVIDRPGKTCVVVALSPPRVVHEGVVKSLMAAINDVYGVIFNDPAAAWAYGGETLRQRRERFEAYHRG